MCEFFAVSRAAYYAWVKKLEEPDLDQERMEQVQAAYAASHKTYGYRRIIMRPNPVTAEICEKLVFLHGFRVCGFT